MVSPHHSSQSKLVQPPQKLVQSQEVKRPMNSFFIYKQNTRSAIIKKYGVTKNSEISRIASALWKQESRQVIDRYKQLAEQALQQHKLLYPDFLWPSKSSEYKKLKRRPSSTPSINTSTSSIGASSTISASTASNASTLAEWYAISPTKKRVSSASCFDENEYHLDHVLSPWIPSLKNCQPILSFVNQNCQSL
jgi:hypothetical protein